MGVKAYCSYYNNKTLSTIALKQNIHTSENGKGKVIIRMLSLVLKLYKVIYTIFVAS